MAYNNARLIEKDIMLGVADEDPGDSEIVDLAGASKFSCQAVYVDDSSSGAEITFQASNDKVNWVDIQAATSISSSGQVMLEQPNVDYRWFKVVKAIDSGSLNLKCLVLVIGDAV